MEQVGDFNCNLLWARRITCFDVYKNMHDFQITNHFPGTFILSDKKDMFGLYKKMQEQFGEIEFGYHPYSYSYPEEYEEFIKQMEIWKEEGNPKAKKKWIFKPSKASCGHGIFIFDSYDYKESGLEKVWDDYLKYKEKVEAGDTSHVINPHNPDIVETAVISEYLDKPLLFKGYKFDLRIYVLVTSFYPLKIYIFREGLVRLATNKYIEIGAKGYDKASHLTNTSIGKQYEGKKSLRQYEDDVSQYVMSFAAFFSQLKKEGADVDLIWNQIYDIIIKTILSVEGIVSDFTKEHFQDRSKCFELYGFDVMIEKDLKPWILEVNLLPSCAMTSKLDKTVKPNLIHNLFNLVGIRDIKYAKCVPSEQSGHRHLNRTTGAYMDDEEQKSSFKGEKTDSDIFIKSPSYKKVNLKFVEPKLTEAQLETTLKKIEEDETLDEFSRKYMKRLLDSKYKIQMIDALAEFDRKDNFIRIFPSPGSNAYFKYFTHKLEINEELYSFLYE